MNHLTMVPRRTFLALGAAIGVGLLTGCGRTSGTAMPARGPATSGTTAGGDGELRGTAARMVAAPQGTTTDNLCRFGAELFRASAPGTGNAVISPYSVLVALGMTEFGATGSALAAMTKVLGGDAHAVAGQLTAVDTAIAAAIAGSAKAAEGSNRRNEAVVVSPANSLFVQKGTRLRPAFLDAIAAGYDASLFTTDYRADPEAARRQINSWVSGKTHELIPELLGQGSVTNLWRLALVNALYLKAQWAEALQKAGQQTDFRTAAGNSVQVEMLRGPGRHLASATGDGWRSASLPYLGDGLAMTILLPDAGAFDKVVGALDGRTLAAACGGQSTLVDLAMPGFKTDFPVDMTGPLKKLGMAPAFDVPMPGMSDGPEPLLVTSVIHQARISVDEHGTEAAAATAVVAVAGAAPGPPSQPLKFTVDRPFLYVIHDTTTRAPLFLGRVGDPTA
jgi:serpin B